MKNGVDTQIAFIEFKKFLAAYVSSIHDPENQLVKTACNTISCSYWLQSFVFCRRCLMKKSSRDSVRVLSIDDIDVLNLLVVIVSISVYLL